MFELWQIKDFAPGEGVTAGILTDDFDTEGWADCPAPGDVHRAIMDAGWIEDPFYDQNEEKVAWMEEKEWWYRTQFDGPAEEPAANERLQLVFHGLDTFVTAYLNGAVIGTHQNMFREAVFDVGDHLCYGAANTLALCFHPPLQQDFAERDFEVWWGRNEERVDMRKAQFGYGWDWGPRLPTIGIWRPVELRRQQGAGLKGVHFHTAHLEADGSQAVVTLKVEVERFATQEPLEAHVVLNAPAGGTARYKLAISGDEATAFLTIKNPKLWWTHDLGDPALYKLTVTLVQGAEALDETQAAVGIRTIELDQSVDTDEPGTRFFRFVLNGVPIFAKGANWIPTDSFVGTIPDEQYAKLITAARDANMNMLRIWGGGLYEHDVFYDLCNQLGILVWQDFMFACAPYPQNDEAFVAEVTAEAEYQVRRLRSHPSMALWCGNNENQWLHAMRNWDQPDELHAPGERYYHDILPRIVADLDGVIPYWPGSPYGGNDFNSQLDGDRHNWNVWHGGYDRQFGEEPHGDTGPEGVSYRRYALDMGRFISEFGMHAAPVAETLRRAIPEDELYFHSPSMDHHNKDNPKNKGDNLMETETGLPDTLEDYIDFSMIAQAEGLKFGIEHYRRRKPHCSGTLFWQLNDCWPVLSWSVLDYYGFGKAGYYYARRFYAPVLASFKALDDGGLELWITNDTLAALADTVTVRMAAFSGDMGREETLDIEVPANSSQCVASWEAGQIEAAPNRYASVRSAADLFPWNRHFCAAIKDWEHESTAPAVRITQVSESELAVELTAEAYVYFVKLEVADENTAFSDNYFDLEPGETRTITVTNAVIALTPDMLTVGNR
ncbi:glycoside hydrolase family 2 protein [Chloroflexota bacterium]